MPFLIVNSETPADFFGILNLQGIAIPSERSCLLASIGFWIPLFNQKLSIDKSEKTTKTSSPGVNGNLIPPEELSGKATGTLIKIGIYKPLIKLGKKIRKRV